MNNKTTLIFIFLYLSISTFLSAQDVCEDEDDISLDANSITKCTIKETDDKKETRQISFQVSSRRRLNRKRTTAQGISVDNQLQKLANIESNSAIVNKLSLKDVDASGVISFYKIDEIPLFKACERSPISQQQKCFKKQISRHVKMNLNYPKKSYDSGIQGRVLVNFIIDKNGNVNITNALFPYKGEQLREEAKRIINKLPTFIPGKQGNVNVNVQYSVKVVFNIPGVERTNIRKKSTVKEKAYTFYELDELPAFKKCVSENKKTSNCFVNELQNHVIQKFAYPVIAVNNDIQGTVTVKFVIDKEGKVTDVSANSNNNASILESAAKRLVQKLPDFTPATIDGKTVNSTYEFPIKFFLHD